MIRIPFFRSNGKPYGNRKPLDFLRAGEEDPFFAEKFRGLRAMVEQKADLHRLKLVGITSSIAGEGKTLACAQLGVSLASTGRKKVLMVDVDVRKADLTHGLGGHRSPGLTDYLLGGVPDISRLIRATEVPNLHLVGAGAEVSSPADLLAGEGFKDFLKEIRERYDMVLLDTAPVLPVADTVTIRDMADGFLVLYLAGHTPYTMFRQTLEELGEKHILGAVLNGVDGPGNHYYEKYYGSYYRRKPVTAGPRPGTVPETTGES